MHFVEVLELSPIDKMTFHTVKEFMSPEVWMHREQVHSLKTVSRRPNWVKHRRQMEKQSSALSG